MTTATHVIVGASLAGAKAAETLRNEGFSGRIVLIGAEPHRPYERPPLSKALLRGEVAAAAAFVHSAEFYEQHEIELYLRTRVQEIDVASHAVRIAHGRAIHYDKLLLATGARPRRLRLPGSDLVGVHYLRTLDDCEHLRSSLATASRVAVIGAGWIGSEVAASARQLGLDVALVDPAPVPLARVLGAEVGAIYRDLHANQGVDLHLGAQVDRFLGTHEVAGVRTTDGAVIDADVVVVGVGVEPRLELARRAGLTIDGGIVVDDHLRTSVPAVFAAGDVAAAWHPTLGRRVRVEHWSTALNQGIVAGKNMLGGDVSYDRLPYFFSDQYDLGMEYSGYATLWDRVVFRGHPDAREFVAFWTAQERVVAAMNVNVWDVVETLQALIRSKRPISTALLSDPAVPLGMLVPATHDHEGARQ